MSRIRQRTKNLIFASLVGFLVSAILGLGIGTYSYTQWSKEKAKIRKDYELQLQEAESIKMEYLKERKKVLVTKVEIEAGEMLTRNMFEIAERPIDQIPSDLIDSFNLIDGKYAKIAISKGGTVIPTMLYEDGITPRDLRNIEYNIISLPSKLKKDEFVDVRINFLNGEDFIVLGKKRVKDVLNGKVWFDVNEQEILNMSSAIVDAYKNDALIYALTYADPSVQDTPIVNYPVNLDVLRLIQTDPNVIKMVNAKLSSTAREVLDSHLKQMSAEDKQKISAARNAAASQTQESTSITGNNLIKVEDMPDSMPESNFHIQSGTPPANISNTDSLPETEEISGNHSTLSEEDIYKEAIDTSIQP